MKRKQCANRLSPKVITRLNSGKITPDTGNDMMSMHPNSSSEASWYFMSLVYCRPFLLPEVSA